MKVRKALFAGVLALVLGTSALFFATRPAAAQGGTGTPGLRIWFGDNFAVSACSTTDYTDVAAKALGMTAAELRAQLAGGKSLQSIAGSKNVTIDTVQKALQDAHIAEIDEAVKNGLLTDDQAKTLKDAIQGNVTGAPKGRGMMIMGGDQIFTFGFGRGAGFVSAGNEVKPYVVAAQALGTGCADLVKAAEEGKSLAVVAGDKLQTVIDALLKAYQDALAKDVTEGLVAPVQADARKANLINEVLMILASPGGMGMGFGVHGSIRMDMPDLPEMPFRFDIGGPGNKGGQKR